MWAVLYDDGTSLTTVSEPIAHSLAEAERQRGRGDVVLLLDPQRRGDGRHVLVGELPVRLAAPGGPVPQGRQQPEILPVPEHPGGHTEPRGGLRDPHEH